MRQFRGLLLHRPALHFSTAADKNSRLGRYPWDTCLPPFVWRRCYGTAERGCETKTIADCMQVVMTFAQCEQRRCSFLFIDLHSMYTSRRRTLSFCLFDPATAKKLRHQDALMLFACLLICMAAKRAVKHKQSCMIETMCLYD